MMISANGQRILKILHLLTMTYWVGGALAVLTLFLAAPYAFSDGELFGFARASMFIGTYMLVYLGAMGTLFTGLAYSLCTNRGFFRHKWVVIKWVITLGFILLGFSTLGPSAAKELDAIRDLGLAALQNPEIQALRRERFWMMVAETVFFILAFILSVYKPWEKGELMRQAIRQGRPFD